MDLLNQVLHNFSIQLSDGGIIDKVFDANLVNLTILDGGLFFLLSDALSENLSKRQEKVLETIQNAEENLKEATTRLNDAEMKLSQSSLVIESIYTEAEKTASLVKNSILTNSESDIERLKAKTKKQLKNLEARVRQKLVDGLTFIILFRVANELETSFQAQNRFEEVDELSISSFVNENEEIPVYWDKLTALSKDGVIDGRDVLVSYVEDQLNLLSQQDDSVTSR